MIHVEFNIQRRHLILFAGILTAALLLAPGVSWASDRFSDAQNDNIFHDDMAWLADAGVTFGCGDGSTYCPKDTVTREQMAAFMHRLSGNDGTTLDGRLDALEADNAALKALLAGVTRNGDTLLFSGMNVQVVNGLGTTDTINGLGNLIVGYNLDSSDTRTGSHMLVVGDRNSYSSYGGIVAGLNNTTSSAWATVTGGKNNTASGAGSSVSGGQSNKAIGVYSSVSGGIQNNANGNFSSVSGGQVNKADGQYSWATGGWSNTASGLNSSVSGGQGNTASASFSSVTGGNANTASGQWSSVAAGRENVALGDYSSVTGGRQNGANVIYSAIAGGWSGAITANTYGTILGGYNNTVTASYATILGGYTNFATGSYATVGGGDTVVCSSAGGAFCAEGTLTPID